MSLYSGNFKNAPGFDSTNLRVIGSILTNAPTDEQASSSQYLQGDVIYQEGNKIVVRDLNEGDLSFNDLETGESIGLDTTAGSISDLVEFINICWNEFENIDSNTIMDAILS